MDDALDQICILLYGAPVADVMVGWPLEFSSSFGEDVHELFA